MGKNSIIQYIYIVVVIIMIDNTPLLFQLRLTNFRTLSMITKLISIFQNPIVILGFSNNGHPIILMMIIYKILYLVIAIIIEWYSSIQ